MFDHPVDPPSPSPLFRPERESGWKRRIDFETGAHVRAGLHFAQEFVKRSRAKRVKGGSEATQAKIGGSVAHSVPPFRKSPATAISAAFGASVILHAGEQRGLSRPAPDRFRARRVLCTILARRNADGAFPDGRSDKRHGNASSGANAFDDALRSSERKRACRAFSGACADTNSTKAVVACHR